MTASVHRRSEAHEATGSAFEHVQAQLEALTGAFALDAQQKVVRGVFRAIFRRSLGYSLGTKPPGRSRLNEDGAPIQFATAVGPHPAPFRFVGDVGPLDGEGNLRMRFAREAIEGVATLISAEAELDAIRPLLDALAPERDLTCRDDPAGALWLGAAFAAHAAPRMRIYVNGGWGSAPARWERLRTFAAHFAHAERWDAAMQILPSALSPLGLAVTLEPGARAKGAIYLRAFGLRLADYVTLASAVAGAANADAIQRFGMAILGKDAAYPTASAVLSVCLDPDLRPAVELEFCGHCLFANDGEARRRLLQLFSAARLDAGPYDALAAALSPGPRQEAPSRTHSFVGVEAKSAGPTYTIYMKPQLSFSQ